MAYPRVKFKITGEQIQAHVHWLRNLCEVVEPAVGPPVVLKDPKDDPVVYTAIAGHADVICTIDRHFYTSNVLEFLGRHGIRVRTNVDLLRELLT